MAVAQKTASYLLVHSVYIQLAVQFLMRLAMVHSHYMWGIIH